MSLDRNRLLKPLSEVERLVKQRIEIACEIAAMDIVTQGDYDDKYKAYYEWHDYNKSFFQSIFTWQTMENDYREIAEAPLGFFGDYTLQNKITDLRINIDIKVKFLTSLLGKIELFEAYEEKVLTMKNIDKTTDRDMSKVFIVHGHDNEAKIEVARFVEKLGFMAIILHEQASENSTIIEKLERNSDVGFGIVVYTPCDKGGKAEDGAIIRPRARQNVVFEHGYLIGKLGRKNVCQLVKGDLEKPGDIDGIVYTPMDDGKAWHLTLAKEIRAAGYDVDMNRVI